MSAQCKGASASLEDSSSSSIYLSAHHPPSLAAIMSAEASSSTVQIVKPASMEQDKYDAIREYRQVRPCVL